MNAPWIFQATSPRCLGALLALFFACLSPAHAHSVPTAAPAKVAFPPGGTEVSSREALKRDDGWRPELSEKKRGISGTDITVHLCPTTPNAPPEGFTDLFQAMPTLAGDIRYHRRDNFTGAPVPGYGAPGAWLLDEAARRLKRVQDDLGKEGLGLIIFDAYRPRRGTDAMVDWAHREGRVDLLNGGYVARRSRHNHGTTVDLGLIDLKTRRPLDMGTDFDDLTPKSRTKSATGKTLKNRLKLKAAMEKEGFRAYFREWWHFELKVKDSRPRDVPYGACESKEAKGF